MSGRRARPGRSGRQAKPRALRKRFLIVCEGEQTEPNYFRAFPVPGQVKVVGTGLDTVRVVHAAEDLVRRFKRQSTTFDEVWCVFDKDSFPDEAFNGAVARVRELDVPDGTRWGAAWSNEAFELWYLLHFSFVVSDLHRGAYIGRLQQVLGGYRKNDPSLYDQLASRLPTAIGHAERLIATYDDHAPPATCRPCTRVVDLVKRLVEASGG